MALSREFWMAVNDTARPHLGRTEMKGQRYWGGLDAFPEGENISVIGAAYPNKSHSDVRKEVEALIKTKIKGILEILKTLKTLGPDKEGRELSYRIRAFLPEYEFPRGSLRVMLQYEKPFPPYIPGELKKKYEEKRMDTALILHFGFRSVTASVDNMTRTGHISESLILLGHWVGQIMPHRLAEIEPLVNMSEPDPEDQIWRKLGAPKGFQHHPAIKNPKSNPLGLSENM